MLIKNLSSALLADKPSNLVLFIRSFSVSAFIGLSYIAILEIAQMILAYEGGLAHASVAFIFYVLGIFANYVMQKNIVFDADNSPLLGFFSYNVVNAFLISGLAGVAYSNHMLRTIFGDYIESASTALALLVISPITFIVFKKIFNR